MPSQHTPDPSGSADKPREPVQGQRYRGVFIAAFVALFAAMVGLAIMVMRYVFTG